MPLPTIEVTLDLDSEALDPSGGSGTVKPVVLTPDLIEVQQESLIQFALSDRNAGARFTAFRYYNTSRWGWDKGWFKPIGGPGPRPEGGEFVWESISADGQTLTVKDFSNNQALYFYILEWTQHGQTYVCDPKIKNIP